MGPDDLTVISVLVFRFIIVVKRGILFYDFVEQMCILTGLYCVSSFGSTFKALFAIYIFGKHPTSKM